jgi:hypothetical protein
VDHNLLDPRRHLPDESDDLARVVGGRQDVVSRSRPGGPSVLVDAPSEHELGPKGCGPCC